MSYITHQTQPCNTSCMSTCLAMLINKPAQDIINKYHEKYRSECTSILNKQAEAEAAKHANSKPAPSGKVVVQGKVISTKMTPNAYGGWDDKMLVEHADGWRVWVTKAAALGVVEKGWVVEFTATLTPSDDDKFFAYGSRPSKASVINQGE